MTTSKDLKRLVRSRMAKTGESYTTARAQLLKKSKAPAPTPSPAHPALAGMAGMADAKVLAKTGRTWAEWVEVLDGHGASKLKHADIARLLSAQYGTPDWWTQTVTVGYERIKGLRAKGQRMDGTYEANKSRTFAVPIGRLFDAWAKPAERRKWLADSALTLRTSSRPKYLRFSHDDGSVVVVGFLSKGRAKSAVAVQHGKLPSREAAARMKGYWADQLDALREVLTV
jgi:hypothetical protein